MRNCEFGVETIAFLYGEMDQARKKVFTQHLESCDVCADEISAFTAIHFSIQNWKAAQFDILPTPKIVFETESSREPANEISASGSWIEILRRKFSFGAFVPVGAFALVLICAGLTVFFLYFHNGSEIADVNVNRKFNEISSEAGNSTKIGQPKVENLNAAKNSAVISSGELAVEPKIEKNALPVKPLSASTNPAKVSAKPRDLKINRKTSNNVSAQKILQSNNDAKPTENRKLPKLNNLPDETEAETLRLADLFAEIGDK